MTNAMAILTEAALRRDRAQEQLQVAEARVNAVLPEVPLRFKVVASDHLEAALAEAEAAERAYEEAQDQPAPAE